MELISLTQTYTREDGNKYLYASAGSGLACTIETHQDGFVTTYPGYWIEASAATHPNQNSSKQVCLTDEPDGMKPVPISSGTMHA
jgi:hypothetical protein